MDQMIGYRHNNMKNDILRSYKLPRKLGPYYTHF